MKNLLSKIMEYLKAYVKKIEESHVSMQAFLLFGVISNAFIFSSFSAFIIVAIIDAFIFSIIKKEVDKK